MNLTTRQKIGEMWNDSIGESDSSSVLTVLYSVVW
jgi:hypothetical protein